MIEQTKAAVTVVEMARMLGFSAARLYQLTRAGVFPPPVYKVSNRRPIYTEELQQVCLDVRRRNCGVNGQPVLFYAKGPTQTKPSRKVKPKATSPYADLMDALRGLGLAIKPAQVEAALKNLYPNGVNGTDQGEVIKSVFLHLKRENTRDNVQ
jgi:hypothetical protein